MKEYEVTNLITGDTSHVMAFSLKDAMKEVLIKSFRDCEKPFIVEKIRMHGLESVASICGKSKNHLVLESYRVIGEWEFNCLNEV